MSSYIVTKSPEHAALIAIVLSVAQETDPDKLAQIAELCTNKAEVKVASVPDYSGQPEPEEGVIPGDAPTEDLTVIAYPDSFEAAISDRRAGAAIEKYIQS